jgi:hypothetical protein
MTALAERVAQLESMLHENGKTPPPVHYPPKTTRGSLHADADADDPAVPVPVPVSAPTSAPPPTTTTTTTTTTTEPTTLLDDTSPQDESSGGVNVISSPHHPSERECSVGTPVDDKKDGLVSRLLSTRGHLSFDQLSGRLRFYGGTVNCHIYSELAVDDSTNAQESLEQVRRAEKCIRTLPIETHDYLMQLFWQHYNSVLQVVHQHAFTEDRERGRTQYYSGFLHVCILAMGFRFADKSRPDIQRISLPHRESTLHREAKYMLDMELERPGGLPSIAALLILGDSEVGVGRDNVGWMYAGMAMRLSFDLGLQLDSRNAGFSQQEMDVRRMTLWACVIYDRYWSLFLGRPLTMKTVDLDIYSLTDRFDRLGTSTVAGAEQGLSRTIYEALIELMEISGKIVEQVEFRRTLGPNSCPEQSAYFKMAALDREIHNWNTRLPRELRYTEENRTAAPMSFYLLHQQYHASLILLHRPFARYDDPEGGNEPEEVSALDSHFSRASRAICTKSAIAIARIFWQHRQHFDGKHIFCTAMQHAGSAATALIAALAHMSDSSLRNHNMQYLEILHCALQDMSHTYQPAERMAAVLHAVMLEFRGGPSSPASIPARRGSTTLDAERGNRKRRQTTKPENATTMPPPPTQHRSRRPSDATSDGSFRSQPPPLPPPPPPPADYVMVTPRSEPTSWSDLPAQDQIQGAPLLSHPHNLHLDPSERTPDWLQASVGDQAFTQQPIFPGMIDPDVAQLEFLHSLPSEEDWSRWHAGVPADVAPDLDGFPPRGRYAGPYQSPSMDGARNG